MRNLISSMAVAGMVAFGGSVPAASAGDFESITDFVAQSGGEFDNNRFDYDILLNAVLAAELDEALADPDVNWTLFAPNDGAFMRLAKDLGFGGGNEEETFNYIVGVLTDLGNGDPIPVLSGILLYHVAPDRLYFVDVLIASIFGIDVPTLEGNTITPRFTRLVDKEPDLVNPSLFVPFNVETGNGNVHTITRVLLPLDL